MHFSHITFTLLLLVVTVQPLCAQKYKILYYGTRSIGELSVKSGRYTISVHGGDGMGHINRSDTRRYTLVPGIFSNNPAMVASKIDSMILVRLYESTNGEEWFEPWNLKDSVYTWKGVKLSQAGHVTSIDLRSNNLTGILPTKKAFPDSVYVLDNLENITKSLRDVKINVFKNQLDYGSLEPTSTFIKEKLFEYDSQAFIGQAIDTTLVIGSDLGLFIRTPGEQNTYQWYLNDKRIPDAEDSIYQIKNISYADTGIYFCRVSNNIAKKTILQTHKMKVYAGDPLSPIDSLNLVKFYTTTGGDRWRNSWDLHKPVLSWTGLIFKDNKLVEINLSKNNLTGEIPNFMDTAMVFKHLVNLNLSSNRLKGKIPSTLGKLENLILLDLDNNQLHGRVPSGITQHKYLKTIWISRNKLTHLPDTIYKWKKLEYLFAHQNQFEEIPASFSHLSALRVLNLNENRLKEIPSYVSDLLKLELFYVAKNQLIRVYPEIGRLPTLSVFDLTKNHLKNLPFSMTRFTNMKQLKIGFNALQFDPIEQFIGQYSTLEYFPQADIGKEEEIWLDTDDTFEISALASGSHNTYQWFFKNEIIPNATYATFKISKLKVTDSGVYHCIIKNTKAKKLSLRRKKVTLHVACNNGLVAKLSNTNNATYCHNERINSLLTLNINRKNVHINWYKDSVQVYNAHNDSLVAKSTGQYYAQVTDQNNCTISSNVINITNYPKYEVEIRSDSTELYLLTKNIDIKAYQWYYYNEFINASNNPSYQATKDGVYTLKVTDQNGCETYSNYIQIVNTATEDQPKKEQVSVFPNPVQNFFYVVTPLSLGEVRISVFDIKGRQMTNISISERSLNEKQIDMKDIPTGIYLIVIGTDEGDIVRKIIKK